MSSAPATAYPLHQTAAPATGVTRDNEPKGIHKLGQVEATAICGNDITSSCLYVSSLTLAVAGAWAPVSLLLVSAVLFLYRGIYSEVVGALPLNGGAYNALLNTTSKFKASLAACLTILSYLATAVLSGSAAVHYAATSIELLFDVQISNTEIQFFSVALLGLFAILSIRGLSESAGVAKSIFLVHLAVLILLICSAGVALWFRGAETFSLNLENSLTANPFRSILCGFLVGMLGISGFESSANFVEEQAEGVFPKTLRNMWIAVTVLNPLLVLISLAFVPLGEVGMYNDALLAEVGNRAAGGWLTAVISLDAFLVLSGAVLTSYIGVTGLVHRLTLDRCLPAFFLRKSSYGTLHRIILAFFFLCAALLFSTGDVSSLAGVYTISFLSVMTLFAVGNALLKVKRGRLPRGTKVSWVTLVIAASGTMVALVGNLYLKTEDAKIFLLYFIPTLSLIFIMLERISIFRVGIHVVRSVSVSVARFCGRFISKLEHKIDQINSQQIVFFTRGDSMANLNQAMLYVRDNEPTNRLKIVHVTKDTATVSEKFRQEIKLLDEAYPEVELELVIEQGEFSPALLKQLSAKWGIPLNFMFIGSPGNRFPHRLSELGGVRLII